MDVLLTVRSAISEYIVQRKNFRYGKKTDCIAYLPQK